MTLSRLAFILTFALAPALGGCGGEGLRAEDARGVRDALCTWGERLCAARRAACVATEGAEVAR